MKHFEFLLSTNTKFDLMVPFLGILRLKIFIILRYNDRQFHEGIAYHYISRLIHFIKDNLYFRYIVILWLLLPAITSMMGCPNPKSPPETKSGDNVYFDNIIQKADDRWNFLFSDKFHIIQTDLYGQSEHVVFYLDKEVSLDSRFLSSRSCLSPNGKYLLIYFCYNDKYENRLPGAYQLLVLDVNDWTHIIVPINVPDYALNWSSNMYWLDDYTFIVPIHKFKEMKEKGQYKETIS